MGKRTKSKILGKTVKLIVEGIESGGELAELLDETALNIRTSQSLRKEVEASVAMYSLFILFAAVIGSPLLYAISLHFVSVMGTLWGAQVEAAAQTTSTIKLVQQSITAQDLFYFSIASIVVTTFFAAMIIGLIKYGREKDGVKYIIPLMFVALAVFFAVRILLNQILGSVFAV